MEKAISQHMDHNLPKHLAIAAAVCAVVGMATSLLGAQEVTTVNQNLNHIATLRWYSARSPVLFDVSDQGSVVPQMLAFDGSEIVATTNTSELLRCVLSAMQFNFGLNWACGLDGFANSGTAATWLAYDGVRLWFANSVNDTVTVSPPGRFGATTFTVGKNPQGIAFDGFSIWVANSGSNTVTKLGSNYGTVQGTFPVGTTPTGVAFDGANIWVANSGSNNVTKLRAVDGAVLGTFSVGTAPIGVAFDGANVWVTNSGSNNVTKLRASDGTVLGTFSVGANPYGIVYDGANIWVACKGASKVYKLEASTGHVLTTVCLPGGPQGLAFDGTYVWATLPSAGIVAKF